MNANSIAKAIFFPLTESRVLVPLVVFGLLLSLAQWGGLLGRLLMFITLIAVIRYMMIILEARAKGEVPATPDAEFFSWFGKLWSLFPLLLLVLVALAALAARDQFGSAGVLVVLSMASVFLPASFVVLAITHSPLQSINPVALFDLLKRCGDTFWIASLFLVVAGGLFTLTETMPSLVANLIQLMLAFSFASLTGSVIQPYDLIDDVYIPDELQLGEEATADAIDKARDHELAHAYGFVSRGNQEGGFRHLFESIDKDPDPIAAWSWYFEHMLRWNDSNAALFFAQHHVHAMLCRGENIPALKVIMRCRLVNEEWKPKREDLPLAIEAAESSGNIELAVVLKRS